MTDKKKPSKGEEDQTTNRIPLIYKRKCQANGIAPLKAIKDQLQKAIQEGKLQTLQLWQELGPMQIRALMDTLTDLNYQHLKKIRIWKVQAQDQGVRAICNYIEKCNTIQYLDLMDNQITALGCQFLGRVLNDPKNKITKLKIDNNPIGTKGLANLTVGLCQNSVIEKLSFNYCKIDEQGVKYFQEILANIGCRLRTLKIQGNQLGNNGAYEVLRAVSICGQKLQKLNMGDVGINLLSYKVQLGYNQQQKLVKQLLNILQNNLSIAKYNFRNNFINDDVAKQMIDMIRENKNIFIIDLPDCISHQLKQLQAQAMKKRKPKKKKKKSSKKNSKKGTKK